MLEALIERFAPTVRMVIDISGVKKYPVNEARAVMDKQDALISALRSIESFKVKFLNRDPQEYPLKDKRFHRPIVIEVPLLIQEIIEIFLKRKLEDLGIDKYKISREKRTRRRKNVSYSC